MKTCIKNLYILPTLTAGLGLILAGRATAQTITTLHSFTGGSDGADPFAGLILSGNTLYGTANGGGGNPDNEGTVFKVSTNGTGFAVIHRFTAKSFFDTNGDGANPYAALILSGNTLYGTAIRGGSFGNGTVFKVNTDGSGFTNLHNFTATSTNSSGVSTNSDGAGPIAGLIFSGNTLYGTAEEGGRSGNGTVFKVNINGTGFTALHSFAGYPSDGAYPNSELLLSDNTLYGTANAGGSSRGGTVFTVNTDGTGFTNLHNFIPVSDGYAPFAGLLLSGNTLYGTASRGGGNSGNGTVFKVNTDGSSFTNLHSFPWGGSNSSGYPTNDDGLNPNAGLILTNKALYGTAAGGGVSGEGTVFKVNTDGTGFTTLHSFTATSGIPSYTNSDGAIPCAVILLGNTLYGTTREGGSSGWGTVFSLSLGSASPPQLAIIASAANVILAWPTNATGFTLQSTTDLVPPAVWTTNAFTPVVVNGQKAVTNPIAGTQQFFRLSE